MTARRKGEGPRGDKPKEPGPPGSAPPEDPDDQEVPAGLKRFYGGNWKETARYADAAYGLLGGLLGFGFIGWLVDRMLGGRHTWLLVGLLVGGGIGFYRLGRTMLGRR
jgi:hypothetical protein